MVYVLDTNGNPLMPTKRNAKVRILIKNGLAEVVRVKPFTIRLLYSTKGITQDITLGIDSGYLNIGFSAISEKEELISGEVKMLQHQKERMEERARYRKIRRQRLRYRAPRFDNRKRNDGWLAPSIQHKLDTHTRFIEKIRKLLPITKVIIEVANFDIQKIKNPNISEKEYQDGEQAGFWNTREYVLHRDGHKCQNKDCKNKSEQKVLQVHHIVFREQGGTDAPSNLITLCNKCHTSPNHKKGKLLWNWMQEGKKVKAFKDSTFMSIVRWRLVNYLSTLDIDVSHTYGYDTKSKRISLGLDKAHYNDAFCIADGTTQERNEPCIVNQVRRNNRSLEKFYDAQYIDTRTGKKVKAAELNNGRATRNKNLNSENLRMYRGEKKSAGRRSIRRKRYFYQTGDLVKYEGRVYSVVGAITYGQYIKLDGLKKTPKPDALVPYRFMKGFTV